MLKLKFMNSFLKLFKQSDSDVKNILKLELCSDNHKLNLEKISLSAIANNQYKEVSNNVLSAGVSFATKASAILANNPNGIFTATIHPSMLTSLANGTASTMAHGPRGIIKHYGFTENATSIFKPLIAFQMLSFITGQYYLNGINAQLKNISEHISMIIKYHKADKISKLKNAFKILLELENTKFPSIEHLLEIRNIQRDMGNMQQYYIELLKDNLNTITQEINCKDSIFVKERILNFLSEIKKHDFDFNVTMGYATEEVLHICTLIELKLNVLIAVQEPSTTRNNRIQELTEKILSKTNHSSINIKEIQKINEEYCSALKCYEKKLSEMGKIEKLILTINNLELVQFIKKIIKTLPKNDETNQSYKGNTFDNYNNDLINIKENITAVYNTPIQILYLVEDVNKPPRLFIKQ